LRLRSKKSKGKNTDGGAFDVQVPVPHRILKGFDVLTCGEELLELFLLFVVGWDVAVVVLPPLLQVPLKVE
jgi:hypothetical protein